MCFRARRYCVRTKLETDGFTVCFSRKIAQRFNAGFRNQRIRSPFSPRDESVRLADRDGRSVLLIGAPVVPEGTQCFFLADFPSVKTLGYFRKASRAKHKVRKQLSAKSSELSHYQTINAYPRSAGQNQPKTPPKEILCADLSCHRAVKRYSNTTDVRRILSATVGRRLARPLRNLSHR